MKYDIVTLGELLIDFTESGRSAAGQRLFEQNPGGAVANVACGAAKLGLHTAFIGKVGNDMHGRFLKETLDRTGTCTKGIVFADNVFTTLAFVSLSPNGEREFAFDRKPGADTCLEACEVPLDLLQNCRVLHVGSLSLTDEPARSATLYAIKTAKKAGAIISYDPNYRAPLWRSQTEAKAQMRSLLPFADYVKVSDAEMELLTDESEPEAALDKLLEGNAVCAVVTMGEGGAMFGFGTVREHIPAVAGVPVVDTTGAGDAFWAAFLSKLSGKRPSELDADMIRSAVVYANAAAAVCVGRRGAILAMPSPDEVRMQ